MRPWTTTLAALVLISGTLAVSARAQQAAPGATSTAPRDYLFQTPTGLLFFHVRPDKAQDFEAVVARVSRGLESSPDDVRRKQFGSWRVFRSTDTESSAVYVVIVDPVIEGADYDPVRMISEFAPAEAQPLYDRLKAAVIRVERMGLSRIH